MKYTKIDKAVERDAAIISWIGYLFIMAAGIVMAIVNKNIAFGFLLATGTSFLLGRSIGLYLYRRNNYYG